ncbi:hypothetical protein OIY81_3414 [Cryptosporidium canis]|uniref:Uncharacterized protein n=1 Tax=Cryptosporidium canis TaxID=195482 RepID=A0ABQ8PBA0_9CRYT|nr:hypothetical protein OIY81_3414 [Cryptosporidium canis]KAJ1615250.1 hypothetical protein OJ252_306 [Cryptosporidium canis]
MAKGLRSKVKRRFRTAKRLLIKNTLELSRNTEKSNALREIGEGTYIQKEVPLNAFLFPESKNAIFPQKNRSLSVDFRSESISNIAGYMGPGNRRKYYPGEEMPALTIMGNGNMTNSRDVEIISTASMNIDTTNQTNFSAEHQQEKRQVSIPVIKDSIKGAYEASFKKKTRRS